MKIGVFALACLATISCFAQNGDSGLRPGAPDFSPHKVQFIAVDAKVRLEVLDWGGSGRSVVLLAGQGDTAHEFDEFAPKLAADYHVFGITRRGIGASSTSETGYMADQLGDDVIAVLDSLNLSQPVLAGWSFGGEELSSVGTRHPERVGGLIYLDAGFSYAYYNPARGDFFDDPRFHVDLAELRRKLSRLVEGQEEGNPQFLQDLLKTDLPAFEKDLQERQKQLGRLPATTTQVLAQPVPPDWNRTVAMMAGMQKYTQIRVPVLAIFAVPHDRGDAGDPAFTAAQANAFEKGVPSARVVRLPYASHAIWLTNEAEVLREIHDFVNGLP